MGYDVTLQHRHEVDRFVLAGQSNAAPQNCRGILSVSDVNQHWHMVYPFY